jgi:DNA repair exonuclease SbcCD ATPase subunit
MKRAIFWVLPIVGGCASWTSPLPLNQPFFHADLAESKTYQALAKKQDVIAQKCNETSTCDHAYFTRALLGLYESREVAEKYFGKVLAVAPKSQLAASSKAWLKLLQEQSASKDPSWAQVMLTAPAIAEANSSMNQAIDRLVRDLLDREVMMQQLRGMKDTDAQTIEALQRQIADQDRKIEALTSKKDKDAPKTAAEQASAHTLQKQVVERDKKIEELSSQLEALKRIDQEMREKVRPIRPPSASVPVPVPDPAPAQ